MSSGWQRVAQLILENETNGFSPVIYLLERTYTESSIR